MKTIYSVTTNSMGRDSYQDISDRADEYIEAAANACNITTAQVVEHLENGKNVVFTWRGKTKITMVTPEEHAAKMARQRDEYNRKIAESRANDGYGDHY